MAIREVLERILTDYGKATAESFANLEMAIFLRGPVARPPNCQLPRVAALNASKIGGALDHTYEFFPELRERRRQIASELSGGQKQMVAMGQAFMAEPKFMLVDELSLGLAPMVVKRLAEALRVAAGQGIGVLMIEQFAHIALELATYALVLERGRLVFDGASGALRDRPNILHTCLVMHTEPDVIQRRRRGVRPFLPAPPPRAARRTRWTCLRDRP